MDPDIPEQEQLPRPPSPSPICEAWLQAVEDYVLFLPEHDLVGCPNCGRTTLRAVMVGDGTGRTGDCYFWCQSCLTGLLLFRVGLLDMVEQAADTSSAGIPRYHTVC